MKPITSYQAFDGSLFNNPKDCADYETHCKSIAKIIDKLPRFPIDDDFIKGLTYYQHDPMLVLVVRDQFATYLDSIYDDPKIRESIGKEVMVVDRSWWYELFIRHNDTVAMMAWRYIGSIDDDFRQWGKPIFTMNRPEGAKPINGDNE